MKKELIPQIIIGVFLLIVIVIILLSIQNMNSKPQGTISYVPLGDSYTIGTGVASLQSWPTLLVSNLNKEGYVAEITNNPARNAFTSKDVITYELPKLIEIKPDIVTLLIGVNDFVKGVSKEEYKDNLEEIISVVKKNIKDPDNIIIITIPDFSETPEGKLFGDAGEIKKGIQEYNEVLEEVAKSNRVEVVDVFDLSIELNKDPNMISPDGLHPSAEAQKKWTDLIYPVFKAKLIR